MEFVELTKTDGARQQRIFVRRESVVWIQSAAEDALPAPDDATPSGSGSILHFSGAPGHTVTVVEAMRDVMALLDRPAEG